MHVADLFVQKVKDCDLFGLRSSYWFVNVCLGFCVSSSFQNERVLFHYNGHGVPKPTTNGEIWVFNKVSSLHCRWCQSDCTPSLSVLHRSTPLLPTTTSSSSQISKRTCDIVHTFFGGLLVHLIFLSLLVFFFFFGSSTSAELHSVHSSFYLRSASVDGKAIGVCL